MGTLRCLLALAVVLNHTGGINGFLMIGGDHAVQMFYAISGFLIAMILNGKYEPTKAGLYNFYTNRILRIHAPYLVVLAVTLAAGFIFLAATGKLPSNLQPWADHAGEFTPLTWAYLVPVNLIILGQDLCLWLGYDHGALHWMKTFQDSAIPVPGFLVNAPSWSMSLELTFYAIAPLIVRRSLPVVAGLCVALFALRFAAYTWGQLYFDPYGYRFFPFELGMFLLGAASFKLYAATKARWPLGTSARTAAFAIACLIAIFYTFIPGSPDVKCWPIYVLIAALLPILLQVNNRSAADRFLGDLSYALYLVHWPVRALVQPFAQPALPTAWSIPVTLASIVAAVAVVLLVERPVDRFRQRRLQAARAATAAEPAPA